MATLNNRSRKAAAKAAAAKPAANELALGMSAIARGFGATTTAKQLRNEAEELQVSGLESMLLGLLVPGVLDAVHEYECKGEGKLSTSLRQFFHGHGFTNPDGSEAKTRQGAFKRQLLATFGVNDVKAAASLWTQFRDRALRVAVAASAEGARAVPNDKGDLVLQPGEGEVSKALSGGKGIRALADSLKPEKSGERVKAGQGKAGGSEGAANAGTDLASAFRTVKFHLSKLAALAIDDADCPASPHDVAAPTAAQLREFIAPIAADAAAIVEAFGDGRE